MTDLIDAMADHVFAICGISVPCGLTGEGLPIGVQLLGKPLDEATLLRAGAVIETACGLGDARPKGFA